LYNFQRANQDYITTRKIAEAHPQILFPVTSFFRNHS
jgi:hypothetical protein